MKITRKEKIIAGKLGVTPAGLDYLARSVAKGKATRRGSEIFPLIDAGHLTGSCEITASGRDLVDQARKMGW